MTLEGDLELYLFTDVWESSVTVVILVQRLRETEHDPGQRVGWPRPLSYPQAVLRLCAGSVVTCSGLVPSPLDLCPKIPRRDLGTTIFPIMGIEKRFITTAGFRNTAPTSPPRVHALYQVQTQIHSRPPKGENP